MKSLNIESNLFNRLLSLSTDVEHELVNFKQIFKPNEPATVDLSSLHPKYWAIEFIHLAYQLEIKGDKASADYLQQLKLSLVQTTDTIFQLQVIEWLQCLLRLDSALLPAYVPALNLKSKNQLYHCLAECFNDMKKGLIWPVSESTHSDPFAIRRLGGFSQALTAEELLAELEGNKEELANLKNIATSLDLSSLNNTSVENWLNALISLCAAKEKPLKATAPQHRVTYFLVLTLFQQLQLDRLVAINVDGLRKLVNKYLFNSNPNHSLRVRAEGLLQHIQAMLPVLQTHANRFASGCLWLATTSETEQLLQPAHYPFAQILLMLRISQTDAKQWVLSLKFPYPYFNSAACGANAHGFVHIRGSDVNALKEELRAIKKFARTHNSYIYCLAPVAAQEDDPEFLEVEKKVLTEGKLSFFYGTPESQAQKEAEVNSRLFGAELLSPASSSDSPSFSL